MKLTIEIQFEIGQIVYLKTDDEQLERICIGYSIRPNHLVVYDLQNCEKSTSHYDFEISSEKDVLKTSTN